MDVTVASAAPMLHSSEATLLTLDIHGNTGAVTAAGSGSYEGGDGGNYSTGSGSDMTSSFDPTFNPVVSFNISLPGIDPSQYPGEWVLGQDSGAGLREGRWEPLTPAGSWAGAGRSP